MAEVQSLPLESWKGDYDEILPYALPAKIRENVQVSDGVCLTGSYTDVC